jgi:hypothetical protein
MDAASNAAGGCMRKLFFERLDVDVVRGSGDLVVNHCWGRVLSRLTRGGDVRSREKEREKTESKKGSNSAY